MRYVLAALLVVTLSANVALANDSRAGGMVDPTGFYGAAYALAASTTAATTGFLVADLAVCEGSTEPACGSAPHLWLAAGYAVSEVLGIAGYYSGGDALHLVTLTAWNGAGIIASIIAASTRPAAADVVVSAGPGGLSVSGSF